MPACAKLVDEQSKHSPSVMVYEAAGEAGPEQDAVVKSSWLSEPPAAYVRRGAAARRRMAVDVEKVVEVIDDFILYVTLRLAFNRVQVCRTRAIYEHADEPS